MKTLKNTFTVFRVFYYSRRNATHSVGLDDDVDFLITTKQCRKETKNNFNSYMLPYFQPLQAHFSRSFRIHHYLLRNPPAFTTFQKEFGRRSYFIRNKQLKPEGKFCTILILTFLFFF